MKCWQIALERPIVPLEHAGGCARNGTVRSRRRERQEFDQLSSVVGRPSRELTPALAGVYA